MEIYRDIADIKEFGKLVIRHPERALPLFIMLLAGCRPAEARQIPPIVAVMSGRYCSTSNSNLCIETKWGQTEEQLKKGAKCLKSQLIFKDYTWIPGVNGMPPFPMANYQEYDLVDGSCKIERPTPTPGK